MTSPKRTIYPDRWLILSRDVFRTICDEPAEDDGLYRLRLDTRLVEQVDFESLAQRIAELGRSGEGSIHLVVDEIDAETMERLMPLARDDIDIQLHDWYESPSDVLMSLGAPDQAVVDILQLVPGESAPAALELASPADLSDELSMRYLKALPAWAELAQKQWGMEFGRHYPRYPTTPIPWGDVVEAKRAPVTLKAADAILASGWFVAIDRVWHWIDELGRRLPLGAAGVPASAGSWLLRPGMAMGSALGRGGGGEQAARARMGPGLEEAPRFKLGLQWLPEAGLEWQLVVAIAAERLAAAHAEVWRFEFETAGTPPSIVDIELMVQAPGPDARPASQGSRSLGEGHRALFQVAPRAGRWLVRLSWLDTTGSWLEREIELPLHDGGTPTP